MIREQIQKCGNVCKKRKTGKVSTFAELETVLFTWYQYSITDADRENIFSLEKSYFQLRQNSAKKQKTMYDFFC
jgi:hemerythrin